MINNLTFLNTQNPTSFYTQYAKLDFSITLGADLISILLLLFMQLFTQILGFLTVTLLKSQV